MNIITGIGLALYFIGLVLFAGGMYQLHKDGNMKDGAVSITMQLLFWPIAMVFALGMLAAKSAKT